MRGLIIRPEHNKPKLKDVTGAFQPGAEMFKKLHQIDEPIVVINNKSNNINCRFKTLNAIKNADGPLDVIAYFGHGLTNGINSIGFYTSNIPELADEICKNSKPDAIVLLYACSTGASPTGFAAKLANAINPNAGDNRKVYAHTSAKHSFSNEDTKIFPGNIWVIEKTSKHWETWKTLIIHDGKKESNTNKWNLFWAKFPFMSRGELIKELGGQVEWEYWLRNPSKAKDVKIHNSSIIGVYDKQNDADNEKSCEKPWDKINGDWECRLRKLSNAIRVKISGGGFIGVYNSIVDAFSEKGVDLPWKNNTNGLYESWLSKSLKLIEVELRDGGIIGIYNTQEDANNEKENGAPAAQYKNGKWECWLIQSSNAIKVKHISGGVISVYDNKITADKENAEDVSAGFSNSSVWEKIYE